MEHSCRNLEQSFNLSENILSLSSALRLAKYTSTNSITDGNKCLGNSPELEKPGMTPRLR